MSELEELADLGVYVEDDFDTPLRLGDVLNTLPKNLYWDELLIAAWDADLARHWINWELAGDAVTLAPTNTDHMLRRRVVLHAAAGDTIDREELEDLISIELSKSAVSDIHTLLTELADLVVTASDDGGYIVTVRPPFPGVPIHADSAPLPSVQAAEDEARSRSEAAEAKLRLIFANSPGPLLPMLAACDNRLIRHSRYRTTITLRERTLTGPWFSAEVGELLSISATEILERILAGGLPAPDYPSGRGSPYSEPGWERTSILQWARGTKTTLDFQALENYRRSFKRWPRNPVAE